MGGVRTPGVAAYAELHCVSNFSFLRGASHPEELVKRAGELGYTALAITDECSVAGVVRAHQAARDTGIQLIIGAEFTLVEGTRLVLLAPQREAYGNLSELITRARRAAVKGHYRLSQHDVQNGAQGCLALWLPSPVPDVHRARHELQWLRETFADDTWIAVELLRDGYDNRRMTELQSLSEATGIGLVASGDVHMHRRARRPLQDVLSAIRLGRTLARAAPDLHANGERCLRSRTSLQRLYPDELLAESARIAARCSFSLDELRYEYPDELVPAGETPASHLRKLTHAGLQRRWPQGAPLKVRERVERELQLIAELQYEPYFLTVHDVVAFARARGILCQGRGSAANSAVCYALGITEVDPDRIDMLFERFISRERGEPPDIDVDFEHERREEVIQYLYNKYGRERAALAATVISYRPKSAVRDVGKALGLSLEQVDRLASSLAWWDGNEVNAERLREAGFEPDHPTVRQLLILVGQLLGFPRHLSQHVGGMVIARDRLSRLVPIENAAMAGRTVIQWDKDDLDALGLLKVDCLALGMLSAIRRALAIINDWRGTRLDIQSIPAEDPDVYGMIQRADTVGVFQIESRAQMAMLPRLKPACFYDLVIEVSIVRPGPIQGDMVHPYLRRRQGLEAVDYPSEEVRAVLERTLGVPIFQEQVIKLAMVAAGFSAGEADHLRRSMAAWRRNGTLQQFRPRLIEGMRARGYSEDFARRVYDQIQGFGEYGFPESHAASFALLVYVSAWLKYYQPAAFTCALLNSQPMGFYTPAQLVRDARAHGVEVRGVDVCASDWESTLESSPGDAPALRLGLHQVGGLSRAGAQRLLNARRQSLFSDVNDMARRAALKGGDLEALAAAGALERLGGHRYRARWAVAGIETPLPLFEESGAYEAEPMLRRPSEGEDILADYASLGLSLRAHPLQLLRERLEQRGYVSAQIVQALRTGEAVRTAGLVVCRQHPSSASGVVFITLEDETGHMNLVLWPSLVKRQRHAVLQARLLGVEGEVQNEHDVLHVVAHRLIDESALLGKLAVRSRDFR